MRPICDLLDRLGEPPSSVTVFGISLLI